MCKWRQTSTMLFKLPILIYETPVKSVRHCPSLSTVNHSDVLECDRLRFTLRTQPKTNQMFFETSSHSWVFRDSWLWKQFRRHLSLMVHTPLHKRTDQEGYNMTKEGYIFEKETGLPFFYFNLHIFHVPVHVSYGKSLLCSLSCGLRREW